MPRQLYMVELEVADWTASLAWYRDVLGLEVELADAAGGFALLRAGPGRLALKAGAPRPGSVALTFEVDDLSAEVERLARNGAEPEGPIKCSPEGYRRAVLHDPDGYRIVMFEWDH